jgi:hypothetical protein
MFIPQLTKYLAKVQLFTVKAKLDTSLFAELLKFV